VDAPQLPAGADASPFAATERVGAVDVLNRTRPLLECQARVGTV